VSDTFGSIQLQKPGTKKPAMFQLTIIVHQWGQIKYYGDKGAILLSIYLQAYRL
jgi:hypothetical protein